MKKKYYIVCGIFIVIIVASLYYVFFRDRDIDVTLDKSRLILKNRLRNIELDRIPLTLNLNFERLLKDFKSISLKKIWSADLDFNLTQQPFFDLKNLYLISFDKIAVFDKNSMQSLWKRQMICDIVSITLLDGNNLLIMDKKNNIYSFNRNTGSENWTHLIDSKTDYFCDHVIQPQQITNNEDKRLLTGIIVITQFDTIKIIDLAAGDYLFSLQFEQEIMHLSQYDQVEQAFYVVYGNTIAKYLLDKK